MLKASGCAAGIAALALQLGGLAFSSTAAQGQNLLMNPSFELGDYHANPDGQSVSPGDSSILGWTVFGHEIAWFDNANTHGVVASDGQKCLDLTGHADPLDSGGVFQTVETDAGGLYQLTFDIGAQAQGGEAVVHVNVYDSSSSLLLYADDFSYSTPSLTTAWAPESLKFTAKGSGARIEFLDNRKGSNSIGLDNTSLTSVTPGPDALTIFAGGLAFIKTAAAAAVRRRRKI